MVCIVSLVYGSTQQKLSDKKICIIVYTLMSLPSRAFSTTASRSSFNSIPSVYANQGGGDKKAGLKPTMDMTQWRNIYYNSQEAGANNLFILKVTVNPNVCQSRPVGSYTQGNVYWKCPGFIQNIQEWDTYPKIN